MRAPNWARSDRRCGTQETRGGARAGMRLSCQQDCNRGLKHPCKGRSLWSC
ncbi:hypothetical protein P7K49_005835 [Saguinus oedipus]|uniref:Uncharacterized protein n=1 Tax=Saguinus oedipus TaxID=9490 RepID=A0ABQ9W2C9_SAGOE|nr:hypothetical protein P7K49_005835 [Saguinus oedipus]